MKTSKIKQVVSAKPHHTGTIYHNLVMENGDKINIGKKTQQKEGWELTYEIVDEQSGEYKQSKSVQSQPGSTNFKSGTPIPTTQSNMINSNDNDLRQRMIIAQSWLSSAVELYKAHSVDDKEVMECAKRFYNWVLETSK